MMFCWNAGLARRPGELVRECGRRGLVNVMRASKRVSEE